MIDAQIGVLRFLETDQRLGLKEQTPGRIVLPAYMDEFCQSRGDFGGATSCQLLGSASVTERRRQQFLSGAFKQLRDIRPGHALPGTREREPGPWVSHVRGGADYRLHEQLSQLPRQCLGKFHVRQHVHTAGRRYDWSVEPRFARAAFMLGIPTRVEGEMTAQLKPRIITSGALSKTRGAYPRT